jgi:hypothetical protein
MTNVSGWARRAAPLLGWALMTVGCGTDGSGLGRTDPGSGTGTLFVEARANYETGDNLTELSVKIRKGGVDLDGAHVHIVSDLGSVDLRGEGGGEYRAVQSGWSGHGYLLDISVLDGAGKETDGLEASLVSPVRVEMTLDTSKPFDPHTLPNQVLTVSWKGPPADRAMVRTSDFEPPAFAPDPLSVGIPGRYFQDDTQRLTITRENSVALAGGLPGSTFSARYRFETHLTVLNPY